MEKPPFNRADYPQLVACRAMPEFDAGITSVDVTDTADAHHVLDVATEAVTRIARPRLSPNLPDYVREPFERSIGLGLVACRVVQVQAPEQVAHIELPTEPPVTLDVPLKSIARERK